MLLPQVLISCLGEIYLGNRSQICRKLSVSSSEIGSPEFILWAIFRDEFRRPNQCLVAFGDYATGHFLHWALIGTRYHQSSISPKSHAQIPASSREITPAGLTTESHSQALHYYGTAGLI